MLAAIAAVLVFVSAADGDTLVVRDSERDAKTIVRLAEVDAPERTQPYSQVSRRNLIALCDGANVLLQPTDIDRYGRTVAHVTCNGINVNWRQVEDGLAWCFTRYLKEPQECLPRQRAARDARKGLWRDAEPEAPWVFRERQRTSSTPNNAPVTVPFR
jgi:micrococcal nuclease